MQTLNSRSSWRSWDYRPELPGLTSRLAFKVNLRIEEAVSGEACIGSMGDASSVAACDWALGILSLLGNAAVEPLGVGFIPGQAQTAPEPGSKHWFSMRLPSPAADLQSQRHWGHAELDKLQAAQKQA